MYIEYEEFRMHGYIEREMHCRVDDSLQEFPVVALLGPRQCGKSTLSKHILANCTNTLVLDLERPSDRQKLAEPEFFLENHRDKLVCIDEIQFMPNLFPVLRALVDADRRPGRFLILGSASQELIRQSSESLAGRVAHYELTPFLSSELGGRVEQAQHWVRGGFPDSVLGASDASSLRWREQFIRTFLERDLAQFNIRLQATTMRRFWSMLAHYHGQVINYSKLAQSMDVSHTTIKRWIDILEQTFMVRVLRPFSGNMKKRLVKSPKIYLRDSGILHALLDIEDLDELLGHPVIGGSWEGFALENLLPHFPRHMASFYRTSSGEEIDLILERKGRRIGLEFKMSTAPRLSRGVAGSIDALALDQLLVVIPGDVDPYWRQPKIKVCSLSQAALELTGSE
jgi:uncharacterized protein